MNRSYFILVALFLIISFSIVSFGYYQSEVFVKKAESVLDTEPLQAIAYYEKAMQVFPLRWDIKDRISGARLVEESQTDTGEITYYFGEIQELPPVEALPKVTLKEGRIFVPILMYHHIGINPRPQNKSWASLYMTDEKLDSELNYLATHDYHAVSLLELYEALNKGAKLPNNPVVLTFDDGYESFYLNAYPILKKYKMKATAFVITQVVDKSPYLSWKEISEMDKSGLVEFGGHTRHHPSLPALSYGAALDEIVGSKSDLESHLGKTINFFAYPYGSYNDSDINIVKQAGFLAAVSTIYGGAQDKNNLYLMPRISADGREGLDIFARRIQN